MAKGHDVAHAVAGPLAYWGLVLKDFAQAWLTYGILTIVIAGITHGIYGIPLWQVSDVILALFLFFVAFVASLSLIACCLDLTRAEFVLALGRLFNIGLLPFLPFGVVLGFLAYGFVSGQAFVKESFVYAGYVGVFSDAYLLATSYAGDFLALLTTQTRVAGSPEIVVDSERLVFLAQVASVLLAVAGFLVGRARGLSVVAAGVRTSPFALVSRRQ